MPLAMALSLLTVAAARPAASCPVQSKPTEWRAVSLDGTLPEGLSIDWRDNYGKAFNECVNEVSVRLRNRTPTRASLDLACRIDGGRPRTGLSLAAAAGRSATLLLDMVKTASVGSVACSVAAVRRQAPQPVGQRPLPVEWTNWVPERESARIDELSVRIIQHVLDDAFRSTSQEAMPVALRIQSALRRVTDLREEPGRSHNLQLRNAEYYLHGLYARVSGDPSHLYATRLHGVYDAAKGLLQDTPLERLLRANPNNPTSPPGGAPWAAAGLADGERIRNDDVLNRPQHGLDLRTLRSAGNGIPAGRLP